MRIDGSVTSISWIPSEAVKGSTKLPFSVGMAHYDDAPPENLGKPLNSIHDEGDPFLFLNGFAIVYTASDSRGDVEVR